MNNDTTTPKPSDPEQPSPEGLDGAACSPSSIYLQVFGDSEDTETPIPAESWGEVTWSKDQVFSRDVQYIRADIVAMLIREIDSCLSIPANVLPPMNMLNRIISENA
jgi:hypothetical protein